MNREQIIVAAVILAFNLVAFALLVIAIRSREK